MKRGACTLTDIGYGSPAIVRRLHADGYERLLLRGSKVLDLRGKSNFFSNEKPHYVFILAPGD